MKVDFIIVGQGLAGTVLALTLLNKSKTFVIIDNHSNEASSLSAAGVSHPLSFKRLILSWNAEKLIPYSKEFYNKACKLINDDCFQEKEMFRIFSSFEEQNNWNRKSIENSYSQFLKNPSFSLKEYNINAPFGFGSVQHASRLNVSKFIKLFRNYFIKSKKVITEDFDYSLLEINNNKCHYNNKITSDKIVFCEGPFIKNNPFFNYLPFGFNKGELLRISSKELPLKLLSKGCFILPTNNNNFIVGSTYNHHDLSSKTTSNGREELIRKLSKIGSFEYKVISQKSGIRPSSIDRKPIIGEHPLIKNIYLFNGLGSKGVMLAPYYADHLISTILQNKKIEKEVSIDRFSKTHLSKFKKL